MSGSKFVTFCVCLAAMLALAASLYQIELAGKRLDARLRELREVLLRVSAAEKYVAAAYLVVFVTCSSTC